MGELGLHRMGDPPSHDLHGGYDVERTLGVGGMATVVLARLDDGRRVAVKELHPFLASDVDCVADFDDEVRLSAAVRHPNVVRTLGAVQGVLGPAMVMEWVDGVDLRALLAAAARAGAPLPLDVVAAIARDVLAGLHAAHEAVGEGGEALAIVHRDVSPENILVGLDGVARVFDFGVAQAACRPRRAEPGAIAGKLGYLAPEQLAGEGDRRADLFAVGLVLWELLTGARMRSGDGVEMLVQIVTGLPAQGGLPSALRPEAAALDAVVACALEPSPDLRPRTAEAMAEALVAAVAPASPSRVAEVVAGLLGVAASRPGTAAATATAGTPASHPEAWVPVELVREPSFVQKIVGTTRGPSIAWVRDRAGPVPLFTHKCA
ncbi:MAG: serine/threonine protein kinase [Deltaproteobacteria bacterium]|nr:serine/threonine protein kinase [Deltaproteobacteria bacterium]